MTATGWTIETLNETSFSDIQELLGYWEEEPPAHVLLALRYLGASKRGKKISEAQAKQEMGQVSAMLGMHAQAMPHHLKELLRSAEKLKNERKGL